MGDTPAIKVLRDASDLLRGHAPHANGVDSLVVAEAVLDLADRLDALRAEVARLDRGTRHVRRVGGVG